MTAPLGPGYDPAELLSVGLLLRACPIRPELAGRRGRAPSFFRRDIPGGTREGMLDKGQRDPRRPYAPFMRA